MRHIFLCGLAATAFMVTGALAQHEGHTAPPADKSAVEPAVTAAIDEKKCGMMAEHTDVAKLVDQLANGFAALENETDATTLKARLAEHGKLLKELQAKVAGEAQKMETMKGKMMGGHQKQ